jgi:hypothetical protein
MDRQDSSSSPLDNPYVIGGVAGIGFFILFFIAIFSQGDTAQYSDNVKDIRTYFTDNANQFLVGDWLAGVAVVFFFFPFIMSLRALYARVDSSGVWANLALLGGITFALISGAVDMGTGGIALDKAQSLDDSSLKLGLAMSDYGDMIATFGLGLLTLASAVVIWRSGVLWRWLGIYAGVVSVFCIIAALGSVDHGDGILDLFNLIGSAGTAIFILLAAICMIRRRNGAAATA